MGPTNFKREFQMILERLLPVKKPFLQLAKDSRFAFIPTFAFSMELRLHNVVQNAFQEKHKEDLWKIPYHKIGHALDILDPC